MDIKISEKSQKSYYLPDKLIDYFRKWCKPNRGYSPKISGAILYYMTLSPEIRDQCEKLAHTEDIQKALNIIQQKLTKIPALSLQPEEKALLMPDKDVELMLKTLLKFKPAFVFQAIGQTLSEASVDLQNAADRAAARDDESAGISAPIKKKRKSQKRKSSKSG